MVMIHVYTISPFCHHYYDASSSSFQNKLQKTSDNGKATHTHWARYRHISTQNTKTAGTRAVFSVCPAASEICCWQECGNTGIDD